MIGHFQSATPEQAVHAIEVASEAFQKWKRVPVQERADVLFKAAEILRAKRFENNAWMILEAGKTWVEADADTAEAIDFCEFYGREALRYAEPQPLTRLKGEDNELWYIPLGRRRRHSALEFSLRHPGRNDDSRTGERQYGCAETFLRHAGHRGLLHEHSAGSRNASGRRQLRDGQRRHDRQCACGTPRNPLRVLYRLQGSRTAYRGGSRPAETRADLDQAGGGGDGREGLSSL